MQWVAPGGRSMAKSVRKDSEERLPLTCEAGQACFIWSLAKIRIASLALLGTAMPAAVGFTISPPFVRWLCLAWLAGVAFLMHGLSQRARSGAVVLSVDRCGILDRRLMTRHIKWQEIEAIWPVNTDRSHVVDIMLRWPKTTLGKTRWSSRIGAHCQTGYGIPAITINVLLLDCDVSEVLEAVARYRPDLLHHTNRKPFLRSRP
jgi:hypothetical protein